jgi:Ca-activated chloride channel family protein
MLPATRLPAFFLAASFIAAGCGPAHKGATLAGGGSPLSTVSDPHLIEMTAENTQALVPADTVAEMAVRIRVTAGDAPAGGRPPLNLVLLLDTSGSMEGKAIEALRTSARDLVDKMDARDHIAVVSFHAIGEVLVPSTMLDAHARATIDQRLSEIEAKGTTAMADGLTLALQQSATGHTADSIDRIVLLGDGVPNDPAPIAGLIASAAAQHVSITALGLGVEFDPILLASLATGTGGVYRYLDKPEAVADVFDHELTRMQAVVGRNLQLQIRPGPGVTIETIPGLQDAGGLQWAMLGDLAAGEHRDVIVPVKVTGRKDGAPVELLDAFLTFDDAVGASGQQQRTAYASAHASADDDKVKQSVTTSITLALSRAKAAGSILAAITQARNGDVAGATATLDAAETDARAVGDKDCDALADQMDALRPHLAELVQQVYPQYADQPVAGEVEMAPEVYEAHQAAAATIDPR